MVQYIVGVGIVLRNNLSWVVSEQPQNNIHRGGGGGGLEKHIKKGGSAGGGGGGGGELENHENSGKC